VLQQGSRCKQPPSLERLSADVRVLAPDGAVLLRSRFGSAGASRTSHAERGAPGRRSGWASSGAVVDTLVGPDFDRRSLRAQAPTWTSILRDRALASVWAPTSRSRLLRLVCSTPPDRDLVPRRESTSPEAEREKPELSGRQSTCARALLFAETGAHTTACSTVRMPRHAASLGPAGQSACSRMMLAPTLTHRNFARTYWL
jgi:hypothetical protein